MKTLLIVSLLLFPVSAFPELENPCGIMFPRGGDEDWGDGAFFMPERFYIPLYNSVNGNKIYGFLKKVPSGVHMRLIDIDGKDIPDYYECQFREWIGHYGLDLLMSKKCESPGYVNVLWKCNRGGAFAKKEDLKEQGAQFYTYWEYLFKAKMPDKIEAYRQQAKIGVNLNELCLNIRSAGNVKAEKIDCIPGNSGIAKKGINHMTILEHKGNWAKVEVTTYIQGPDDDDCFSVEKGKKIGWVKAIDEKGFPNIWYSVTGY